MKKRLFNRLMKKDLKSNDDYNEVINNRPKIIHDMINFCHTMHPHNDRGHLNLIIGMEELSELQKEVSKGIRGKLDRNALLEEMVDVEGCLLVLRDVYNITDEELNKARYIKTSRIKRKVDSKTFS